MTFINSAFQEHLLGIQTLKKAANVILPYMSSQAALGIGATSEDGGRREKEQACGCFSFFCNVYFFTKRGKEQIWQTYNHHKIQMMNTSIFSRLFIVFLYIRNVL